MQLITTQCTSPLQLISIRYYLQSYCNRGKKKKNHPHTLPSNNTSEMIPKLNARMGLSGCRKIGYIRILLAAIHIFDRLLLGMDLGLFLSPKDGLLPIDTQEHGFFGLNSQGRNAEDDTYLWLLYSIGLLNAVLLLLGIAPRLNAISFYFNTCSFHNMNWMLCDGVFTGVCPLVRIFSFIFVFLPLHHITIWDKFGRNLKYHKDEECSWVMWPVWLLQWQSVFVMLGAMVGKLDGDFWMNGTAMYYVCKYIFCCSS